MRRKISALFQNVHGRAPVIVARAPGRIEFIGNHTDYNGGPVLGASVDRGVWVAVAPREDGQRRFFSGFTGACVVLDAAEAVKQTGAASWINYPLGVIEAFPAFGLKAPGGFDYVALSDLPAGAGLSSSAAIELASALAFLALTDQAVDRETLVKIGRWAENHFVGVPCGMLDQGVSAFGEVDRLVFIDCRGPRFSTVPMSGHAHFWIFNTHTQHALVDGLYAARHRECTEAARALGVPCLADVSAERLEAGRGRLSVAGYQRAKHVVDEVARVSQAVEALNQGDLSAVGRLLTASHQSSRHWFENSTAELDFLVDALVATPGVYGARLTGGGFGGAVMALTNATFGDGAVRAIAESYTGKYGATPDVLHMRIGAGAARL